MVLKKIHILLFLLIAVSLQAQQAIGTWKPYMAYQNSKLVTEAPNKVFAVYDNSLLSFSPDDNEVKLYSKSDGLNDVGIVQLGYNKETGSLVIIYQNANIDIFTNNGVYNLPYIKNNTFLQNKTIYNLEFEGNLAYISTGFGIVVVNLKDKTIKDTYTLNKICYSVCTFKGYIYAATAEGIYRAPLSSNLKDKNNWKKYPLSNTSIIERDVRKLLIFNDYITFHQTGNGVYYIDNNNITKLITNGRFKQITLLNNQLTLLGSSSITYLTSVDPSTKVVLNGIGGSSISQLNSKNKYWIACGTNGLTGIERDSSEYQITTPGIKVNSPKRDLAFSLTYAQNKLLVTGGGAWVDFYGNPGTLMVLENGSWYNFDEEKIAQQVGINTCKEFMYSIVDPKDPNHYFVSSWGNGLYEFQDNIAINLFTNKNSTLAGAGSSTSTSFRVGGMAFDADNNLYVLNAETQRVLNVFSKDRQWSNYLNTDIAGIAYPKDILITSKTKQKWVDFPRRSDQACLFVFDDSNLTDNIITDNQSAYKVALTDKSGSPISGGTYRGMAEDLDGNIWVGTDNGPVYFNQVKDVTKALNSCIKPLIPKNDGTDAADYLLGGQTITAIAVDGGNRKWIGTSGSGIFLVSPSGDEVYENFTAENSPLLSNTINSIAIKNETGEVFIATDKGLISYMGDAITGKPDYSDVYAFPNPVRPQYDDQVTVTGLMANSTVKITDLNGNLMTQGKSAGGQFSWDCRNRKGEIVSSGIYLVLSSTFSNSATGGGGESVVGKIMVVR